MLLSLTAQMIAIKIACPDHRCPHYIRNTKSFDPKYDSCDACLDDEYEE